MKDSRRMFNDNALNSYEMSMNTGSSRVASNPTLYDKEITDYQNSIYNSTLPNDKKLEAIKLGYKNMAQSAVDGFTNAGDYENAKRFLNDKASGIFDPKERQKMFDNIDKLRSESIRQSAQKSFAQEIFDSKARDKQKILNQNSINKQIDALSTMDEADPNRVDQTNSISSQIDSMVQNSQLDPAQAEFLKVKISGKPQKDNGDTALDIYQRMLNGENPKVLREDVLKAVTSGDLSAQTGQVFLDKVDRRSQEFANATRAFNEDGDQRLKTDPLKSKALSVISAQFENPLLKFDKSSTAIEKFKAMQQFENFYQKDPKTKGNALKSLNKVLSTLAPGSTFSKNEKDLYQKDPQNYIQEYVAPFKSTDKEEYARRLQRIVNFKQAQQLGGEDE